MPVGIPSNMRENPNNIHANMSDPSTASGAWVDDLYYDAKGERPPHRHHFMNVIDPRIDANSLAARMRSSRRRMNPEDMGIEGLQEEEMEREMEREMEKEKEDKPEVNVKEADRESELSQGN